MILRRIITARSFCTQVPNPPLDKKKHAWKAILAGVVASGAIVFSRNNVIDLSQDDKDDDSHRGHNDNVQKSADIKTDDPLYSYGREVAGKPFFSAEEVSSHSRKEDRIWVTFRSGVYDVTDFIDSHPGGTEKISMAAGGAVDPFWELYSVHLNPNVLSLLEEHRIGNLKAEDRIQPSNTNDHWANEPKRHSSLAVRSQRPFNAEPPPSILADHFITPNSLFFVRNHLPVPVIDEKDYRLEISGIGIPKPISLSLEDLKTKFPAHTMTSTIQCSGNRRSEMNQVKEVKGLFWGKAAISNASWTGVRLIDLLKACQADLTDERIKHVEFEGLDADPVQGSAYAASVPAERVLDARADVLIAYSMNGQPIPRDHGFPVRVIVPGIVGARQVKWLGRIILTDEESQSHWQQADYKGFHPSTDAATADYSKAQAIQDYPIQSAICSPDEGQVLVPDNGFITVKGYAWSGGGRSIIRVDVSMDGGKTWSEAELTPSHRSSLYKSWDWTLWQIKLPVSHLMKGDGKEADINLVCKATDSSYSSQPESFEGIWNFRGVLSNAWSRVNVKIVKD
jgi:sulfite oxidase